MPALRAPKPAPGRIGRTLLANLALIGLATAFALFLLLGSVIRQSFGSLEDHELAGHVGRVEDFERSSLRTLTARAKDWGIWDETFFYAQDFGTRFEDSNINDDSFVNAQIDGLAVYRYDSATARSFFFDHVTHQPATAFAAALRDIAVAPVFVERLRAQGEAEGFVPLRGKLYALAAVEIHRSDGTAAAPGFIVFVQQIDAKKASQALQVPVKIDLERRIAHSVANRTENKIALDVPMRGLNRETVAVIELHLKRPLMMAARELLLFAFGSVLVPIAIMLLVLNRRVRSLVLDPVDRLHRHVVEIRETGELRALGGETPDNELGALQGAFDHMARELQDLRSQLESQSFALGKSQSAIGLMHNLRNSLSPVRVILETLEREAGAPLPPQAARALAELAGPEADPTRREKLAAFLAAAHEQAEARSAVQRQQVREAARNLMGALAAIDTAQHDRGDLSVEERCDLARLLSHSGNIVRYVDDLTVDLVTTCDSDVSARGNRVLLSQVLENLVTNALESIRATGRSDGAIRLHAARTPDGSHCVITVADNGAGFGPSVRQRLFERGFSTRTSKSGGLGLHWCANTLGAMRGALSLDSPGEGHGAVATITLPLWEEQPLPLQGAA